MKSIIILIAIIAGVTSNATATEIHATMSKTDGNTMITCVPDISGELEKAYISLYVSDNQELFISRKEMEVSYDNVATYILQGNHDIVEGKCKFVFSRGDKSIVRENFTLSMN